MGIVLPSNGSASPLLNGVLASPLKVLMSVPDGLDSLQQAITVATPPSVNSGPVVWLSV